MELKIASLEEVIDDDITKGYNITPFVRALNSYNKISGVYLEGKTVISRLESDYDDIESKWEIVNETYNRIIHPKTKTIYMAVLEAFQIKNFEAKLIGKWNESIQHYGYDSFPKIIANDLSIDFSNYYKIEDFNQEITFPFFVPKNFKAILNETPIKISPKKPKSSLYKFIK